jgi:thiosulfate dehydrogenase (quinone) large subunit
MTNVQDNSQVAKKLAKVYGLRISDDIIASALTGKPKLPILLARASFRADVDTRTNHRAQIRRDRRNFLRAALALAVVSTSTLILANMGLTSNSHGESANLPQSQPNPSAFLNPPIAQNSQPVPGRGTQPIANAANLPPDRSLTYNDPSMGPIILIHLDNGQFVAYSSICTHAGCQVQFDPSMKDLVCPCHGAVYDPYHNAQVLSGPAPYPLQKVPIQYDSSTGNIYLNG